MSNFDNTEHNERTPGNEYNSAYNSSCAYYADNEGTPKNNTYSNGDVRILEVDGHNTALLNQSAMLLVKYFMHVAGDDVDNININDWSRLNDIITGTRDGKHRIFLAFVDGEDKPVGIGGINRQGCAMHLYVLPEYRGKGVARALVKERFDKGAWFTTVLKTNFASLSLMRKVGLHEMYDYENLSIFVRPSDFTSGDMELDFLKM